MKYFKILFAAVMFLSMAGCKKFLDKPPLTSDDDEHAWVSEQNVSLYANRFYPIFFTGYGTGYSAESDAALLGYQFSDDVFINGTQGNFNRSVPTSSIWSMTTVRSINIMIDRIQSRMKGILTDEAYNHWLAVGRFYRGMQYANLVNTWGDVPYYDYVPSDTAINALYKPRTPRNVVMDSVYNDLRFAFQNIRTSDGDQKINRYVVAGFITRLALREASWQKYYEKYKNPARAEKFFRLAIETGDYIINSGKYDIVTDFRTLFTSYGLSGNKDVIFYRHYDPAVNITHAVGTNSNLNESIAFGPSTDLIKSFICTDGQPYQTSTVTNSSDFTLSNMVKTRDSRLEATFYDKPSKMNKASYWYIVKFAPRSVINTVAAGGQPPTEFTANKNYTDYPILRYAEILLNWVEAKAELGIATQADIDVSVNKIRNRPLAAEAASKGVQKTAPMNITALPDDPARDKTVSQLLWEIRRERRMEFAFEYSRYQDLRRWSKLNYMDTDANKNLLSGGWVNFSTELPGELVDAKKGQISVVDKNGNTITYNGSNGAAMNGFYKATNTVGRLPFLNITGVNPYLTPIGKNEMDDYKNHGYMLDQTEGWPVY